MTEIRTYHCRICTDVFPSASAVFKHQRETHPDNPKVKASLRRFMAGVRKSKNGRKVVVVKHNGNGALAHPSQEQADDVILDFPLGYAVGRIEEQLASYARGIRVPPASFTSRVARLLQRAARGQVLGA